LNTFRINIKGLVQGVGFRPFIYRLALEYGLKGTVENRNDGVVIYINCMDEQLFEFVERIKSSSPPASKIEKINYYETGPIDFNDFIIVKSTSVSEDITEISPDIAVCNDCLADMKVQPNRIDYPFINCTNCGPRYTIIKDLPYDREKTTMNVFEMCVDCREEYTNILDRRFHAQPVACSVCGPQYTLYYNHHVILNQDDILETTAYLLQKGKIVAIKGVGGFFIACDAMNEEAVSRLRILKNREAKPFAVMFRDHATVKKYAFVDDAEEEALVSLRRPIVLLRQKKLTASSVCAGFDTIGAMLPYMPFHYLLFEKMSLDSIVLTSGNISDEPILIDNEKAVNTLGGISDAVLTYNREIHNRVDDSVSVILNGDERMIRRSRGYAPVPIGTSIKVEGILATGAELVNCFCIGKGNQAIMSQHIGDLKNLETYEFYAESIEKYKTLFRFRPKLVVTDFHPDYFSSRYAEDTGLPLLKVQHHHAHIASCMAEHGLDEKVIGVAMDGSGLGDDGHIWGGEFMVCDYSGYERISHFEYIPLPGGDKVTHEPWRTAVSMLYKVYGSDISDLNLPFLRQIDSQHLRMILSAIDQGINTPLSSGAGRLFDAVSAMTGICPVSRFHAEAPMRLESAIRHGETGCYDFISGAMISFEPMVKQIVQDILQNTDSGVISARFHNTVIASIIETVENIRHQTGLSAVALSGGSFQNRYLSQQLENKLRALHFNVYVQKRVPANDGGLALGQLVIGGVASGAHH
jgi:hydrogenase maturation protein HypF